MVVVTESSVLFIGPRRSCLSLVRVVYFFNPQISRLVCLVWFLGDTRQLFFFFRHFLYCLQQGHCHLHFGSLYLCSCFPLNNWRVGVQLSIFISFLCFILYTDILPLFLFFNLLAFFFYYLLFGISFFNIIFLF